MIPYHIYYQLVIVGLLWLCVMLHSVWPSPDAVSPPPPVQPVPPQLQHKRSNEPKPFVGLSQRPHCAVCEHEHHHPEPQPGRVPLQSRLLLDSRVVDVPIASNPACVTLSSLKPFCFNDLHNE